MSTTADKLASEIRDLPDAEKLRLVDALAQEEVDESVRWYDEQASLGGDFLDELDRAVRLIKSHPLAATEIEPEIRRCLLQP